MQVPGPDITRPASGFTLTTPEGEKIRFLFYRDAAPLTCKAFEAALPFSKVLLHARLSGQEIWTDEAPSLDVIQENASVFTEPGEVVIGPRLPARTRTAHCLGIYYGEGRGLDACNIFAAVAESDRQKLSALGERIWKEGAKDCLFSLPD